MLMSDKFRNLRSCIWKVFISRTPHFRDPLFRCKNLKSFIKENLHFKNIYTASSTWIFQFMIPTFHESYTPIRVLPIRNRDTFRCGSMIHGTFSSGIYNFRLLCLLTDPSQYIIYKLPSILYAGGQANFSLKVHILQIQNFLRSLR